MRSVPATALLAGALLVGWVSEDLMFGEPIGLGTTLSVSAFVIALVVLSRTLRAQVVKGNWWLLAPLGFFALMLSVRSGPLVTSLNVLACVGLVGLLAACWQHGPAHALKLIGLVGALVESGLGAAFVPFSLLLTTSREARSSKRRQLAFQILRGVLLALPLLYVFTALFASADLVFGGFVHDWLAGLNLGEVVVRGLVASFLAWISAGTLGIALGYSLFKGRGLVVFDSGETGLQNEASSRQPLGLVEALIAIGLVDLLFASFVFVQIRYLFLAADDFGLRGVQHAFYAREGFFQLLVASVLTFALVLAAAMTTRRPDKRARLVFNLFVGILVACTLVILVSSFRRLYLYELEYGFTQDRIVSHSFTVWLAVVFVLFLAALVTRRWQIFSFGLLISMIGYCGGMNLVNPDAFIASQNIGRYLAGKPLDTEYLARLSDDALPILVSSAPLLRPIESGAIQTDLTRRRQRAIAARERLSWRSLNLAREQAWNLLSSR